MITISELIRNKERFDEFILKLKDLMKEYKVVLSGYDNYDGDDSYCGTEYMFESDQWSQDIRDLL